MTDSNQHTANTKRIPIVSRKAKWTLAMILAVVGLLYYLAILQTNADPMAVIVGFPLIFDFIINDFLPPNWGYIQTASAGLLETWNMALLGTTIATIVCLPLSFLAANNINRNKYFYNIIRFCLNVVRTIPEFVLAVVLVGLVGLGAMAGTLALAIFSIGMLAKLMSETIETVHPGPLEAIKASGGNIIQVIWYGVMPQILPHYASYTLYVLEINVRASVVLGFVGAGGIGQILQQQIGFLYYDNVAMIIIVTFVAIMIIDGISNRIRERLV